MKKIFLWGGAAIFTALSLSSFKKNNKFSERYYFTVIPNLFAGSSVLPGDVTFLGNQDPGSGFCPESISVAYMCVICVTINQVTHTNFSHLNGVKHGATVYTRSSMN